MKIYVPVNKLCYMHMHTFWTTQKIWSCYMDYCFIILCWIHVRSLPAVLTLCSEIVLDIIINFVILYPENKSWLNGICWIFLFLIFANDSVMVLISVDLYFFDYLIKTFRPSNAAVYSNILTFVQTIGFPEWKLKHEKPRCIKKASVYLHKCTNSNRDLHDRKYGAYNYLNSMINQ